MKLDAERFTELRKKNGFSSHKKLANEVKFPESTIRDLESGRAKDIKGRLILSLSHLYNVSADFILTGKEWITVLTFDPPEKLKLLEENRILSQENRLLKNPPQKKVVQV